MKKAFVACTLAFTITFGFWAAFQEGYWRGYKAYALKLMKYQEEQPMPRVTIREVPKPNESNVLPPGFRLDGGPRPILEAKP